MFRFAIATFAVATGVACGGALADPAPNNTIRTNGYAAGDSTDVPPNYRELVAAYLKESVVDPSSLKDVGISEPAVRPAGWFRGRRPTVCVSYDAKNRRGLYTGASSTLYFFKGGQVAGVARRQALCNGATYTAFREADPHAPALATRPSRPSGAASERSTRAAERAERPVPKPSPRDRVKDKTSDAAPSRASYEPARTYQDERRGDTWYRQRS